MIYSAFNEIITRTFNLYDVIDFFKIEPQSYNLSIQYDNERKQDENKAKKKEKKMKELEDKVTGKR